MNHPMQFDDIKPAPIRHSELPEPMLRRIRAAHAAVADVLPLTLDEWIDGFKRDENPERELEIWERMGGVYQLYTAYAELSDDQKMRVLRVVLGVFCGMPVQQMADDLANLPPGAAGEISSVAAALQKKP
jgi:hypothetical protein